MLSFCLIFHQFQSGVASKGVSHMTILFAMVWKYVGNPVTFPANIYLFKMNNRNTRKRCEICSKLTIKTPKRRHWTYYTPFSGIIDSEQVNVSRVNDSHPTKINRSLPLNQSFNEYKNTLSLRYPRECYETDFYRPRRDLFKVNIKYQNKVWNIFKINNKEPRTRSFFPFPFFQEHF